MILLVMWQPLTTPSRILGAHAIGLFLFIIPVLNFSALLQGSSISFFSFRSIFYLLKPNAQVMSRDFICSVCFFGSLSHSFREEVLSKDPAKCQDSLLFRYSDMIVYFATCIQYFDCSLEISMFPTGLKQSVSCWSVNSQENFSDILSLIFNLSAHILSDAIYVIALVFKWYLKVHRVILMTLAHIKIKVY